MAKKFPDLTGDGKVTQKDILKGRGVLNTGGKVKKKKGYAMGGPMKKKGYAMGGPMKKKGYAMGGGPMKKKGYAMGGPMKKGYKKGGKVRGAGIAMKGVRPAKMVKMKGS
jgi:hypothetical protein